jgi:hypothetical protein
VPAWAAKEQKETARVSNVVVRLIRISSLRTGTKLRLDA